MEFVKFRLQIIREILRELGGKCNSALADQIQGAIDGVEDLESHKSASLAVTADEVLIAIGQGKIPAIREYRSRTGSSLVDSKNAIERMVPPYLMDMRRELERLKEIK